MSALGQKHTSDCRPLMSALPPKADIVKHRANVRFGSKADSYTAANSRYSIMSSARIASVPSSQLGSDQSDGIIRRFNCL
jgi:hypothetical protein